MAAQDLDADGVERAEPRHALDGAAHQRADALLHLARRLVGEGDGQDLGAARAARAQDVGNAGGEHAGLAGAGPRQHQHRSVDRLDGGPLLRVEVRPCRGPRAARAPAPRCWPSAQRPSARAAKSAAELWRFADIACNYSTGARAGNRPAAPSHSRSAARTRAANSWSKLARNCVIIARRSDGGVAAAGFIRRGSPEGTIGCGSGEVRSRPALLCAA